MSAELLSKAASEIRRRAEAAPPGSWHTERKWFGSMVHAGRTHLGPYVVATGTAAAAEHITSWNPAVALAVADWLDDTARTACVPEHHTAALAVARTYLGETA